MVGEGTGCTAMDQVFHVDCFVCMTCSTKLRGKPFYAVEKKAYCEPCYITLALCLHNNILSLRGEKAKATPAKESNYIQGYFSEEGVR